MDITVDNGKLIISPAAKPKYRLADLIAQGEGDQVTPDSTWLDAPSTGKEAL